MMSPSWWPTTAVAAFNPERPFIRGTAQNPDVYFQGRESSNGIYNTPGTVQKAMDAFAKLTGRAYKLYEYFGAADAERVIVVMGSAVETVEETVKALMAKGEKVGVLAVRLYRPFDATAFVAAIPASVKKVAVLDRTKEPGSQGEPLFLDVVSAANELGRSFEMIRVVATVCRPRSSLPRWSRPSTTTGLGDPQEGIHRRHQRRRDPPLAGLRSFLQHGRSQVRALPVLRRRFRRHRGRQQELDQDHRRGDRQPRPGLLLLRLQEVGRLTVSHLRFGPNPIRAPYLIEHASFVACHAESFLEKVDMLKNASPGAVFLLNTTWSKDQIWGKLPREVQSQIIAKKLQVLRDRRLPGGQGHRHGQPHQHGDADLLLRDLRRAAKDEAIAQIKKAIKKTYGKRGEAVVQQNFNAVDKSVENLFEVSCPGSVTADHSRAAAVPASAPEFVQNVLGPMIAFNGDELPVGHARRRHLPVGTTAFEKRNFALEIPEWDSSICIQCAKCSLVCPHAVIRMKVAKPEPFEGAPEGFKKCPPSSSRNSRDTTSPSR
jgi:pyruvate-ferredoxin/flavodoxin oxidoreductase